MRLTSRITSAGLTQTILLFLLVFLAGAIWTASPANAQPVRASDTFYLKFGAGLSDFAGDAGGPDFGSNPNAPDVPGPINGFRDLFDTEKFSDGGPFPYALSGEVGYHFSPSASVGLGYQFGHGTLAMGAAGPDSQRRTRMSSPVRTTWCSPHATTPGQHGILFPWRSSLRLALFP